MPNILKRANQKTPFSLTATVLAISYFASFILGFLRDRLLVANFGVGPETDAYFIAFTVPDFMFFVLTSGALSVAFIPVFNERIAKNNKQSAWELSSSLLNLLSVLTLAAAVLIMVFAEFFVSIISPPDIDKQATFLAVSMMRIIAINPFLFAISSVLTSMQQAVGRFFFYAVAPLTYSFGIIFGIIVLAPLFGIIGVAYGVVIGAIIQLLVGALGLLGMGYEYQPIINWNNLGFKKVLSLLPARSFDQGIDYFITLVETGIASRLGTGFVTAYQFAFKLHYAPIALIGIAISTAAFPRMSERLNQGRPDLFKKELRGYIRLIVWLALPVATITFFGRGYIARFMISGVDHELERNILASILGFLVIAIIFRTIFHIASRSFYANQDTRSPLYISIGALIVNVGLALLLGQKDTYRADGLAIAQSVTAFFEVVVLFYFMAKRYPGLFSMGFWGGIARMVLSTGLMAVITYSAVRQIPLLATDVGFFTLATKFGIIVSVSFAAYIGFSYVFRLKESQVIISRIQKIVFKPIRM